MLEGRPIQHCLRCLILINPLRPDFFHMKHKMCLKFISFLHTVITQVVEILPSLILHTQYHGRWCPGDARSRGISHRDVDCAEPELFGPRTLRVNILLRRESMARSMKCGVIYLLQINHSVFCTGFSIWVFFCLSVWIFNVYWCILLKIVKHFVTSIVQKYDCPCDSKYNRPQTVCL